MKAVEQKFIKFVKAQKLISSGDRILVALSGGADSVCLTLLLIKFLSSLKFELGAAHINHQLRGDEADEDEKFCRVFCYQYKIPFYTDKIDVKKEASNNKKSIEEAARDLRYKSLSDIAGKNNFNKIATAHNSNDNAETVLFNLIKGTGISGFSGIPLIRENIIRPLLNLSRDEIENYLGEKNIEFMVDSTNAQTDFSRNFIRHEIFPKIREINPSFETSFLNTSLILRDFNEFIKVYKFNLIDRFVKSEADTVSVSKELFKLESKFICGEVIKDILRNNFGFNISLNDYQKLIDLAEKQSGVTEELNRNLTAVNDRENIVIRKKTIGDIYFSIKPGEVVKVGEMELGIDIAEPGSNFSKRSRKEEIISADNTDDIFILRRWKLGDKFKPLGMRGEKKISDFLTDEKVPSSKKKEQLILLNRNNIVWVVGLRLDNRYKVVDKTRKKYRLWMK